MRKNLTKVAVSMAVFAVALLASFGILKGNAKVYAANVDSVSDLTQTDAQKHELTVSWSASEGASVYYVYYKDAYQDADYHLAGTTSATSFTISGLASATQYNVKVEGSNGVETGYPGYLYDAVTIPDQMEEFKQEKWWFFIKKLDVSWRRQTAVEGTEVILYDNKGKKVTTKTAGKYSSSVSFDKMKDKVYSVKARSFMTWNGQKYYSDWAQIYCLNQARIKSAKVKGSTLKLSWGKVDGATGYRIYVSTKKGSGFKKAATVGKNKTSFTLKKFRGKKFSSKKTYYVYVETVCNKKGSKNSSGGLYFWNTKDSSSGYILN